MIIFYNSWTKYKYYTNRQDSFTNGRINSENKYFPMFILSQIYYNIFDEFCLFILTNDLRMAKSFTLVPSRRVEENISLVLENYLSVKSFFPLSAVKKSFIGIITVMEVYSNTLTVLR